MSSRTIVRPYSGQTEIQCYRLIQLRGISMRSTESRDHYLVEIISYIGERVTSKTDEINWRFH